jgi:MFS family permease
MYTGFIISTFAVCCLISCVVTGNLLTKMGRSLGIKIGMALLIIQLIIMGSLIYVDEYATFIGLSFLAMALGGIGAGINSTCSLAIISSFYPDQKELYIGILEAGSGIGLLTGPLFGGILY